MANPLPFLVPIRASSRLYLRRQLEQHGVDFDTIPEKCIQELADRAIETSKTVAKLKGGGWRENVADMLDSEAVNIASMIFDDRDQRGRKMVDAEYQNRTLPLLTKYRVPLANLG